MSSEIGWSIIVLVCAMAIAARVNAVLGGRAKTWLIMALMAVIAVVGFVIRMRGR